MVTNELRTNNVENFEGNIIINGNLVLGEISSFNINMHGNSFVMQGYY